MPHAKMCASFLLSSFMKNSLEPYLNHHLTGSAGALVLLDEIISRQELPEEIRYFKTLRDEVKGEQDFLRGLLESAHLEVSKILEYADAVTARGSRTGLALQGISKDELGLLDALEVLALGFQGKRLLWKALEAAAPSIPAWRNIDFKTLERAAVRQRDGVEKRRMAFVRKALWQALEEAS